MAGAIAWTGLLTNTLFLLVAAMLVAPYPSPAMNTALGTARGDLKLLSRSVMRYFVVLAIGVVTAVLLSLVFKLEVTTDLMRSISFLSPVTFIIPVAAGVAGGLYLGESERSSLLSAASAGVLVALALAPPTATLGMAAVLGDWAMAKRVAFLLLLQIAGINLSGALVLRLYRLRSSGVCTVGDGIRWFAWRTLPRWSPSPGCCSGSSLQSRP